MDSGKITGCLDGIWWGDFHWKNIIFLAAFPQVQHSDFRSRTCLVFTDMDAGQYDIYDQLNCFHMTSAKTFDCSNNLNRQ